MKIKPPNARNEHSKLRQSQVLHQHHESGHFSSSSCYVYLIQSMICLRLSLLLPRNRLIWASNIKAFNDSGHCRICHVTHLSQNEFRLEDSRLQQLFLRLCVQYLIAVVEFDDHIIFDRRNMPRDAVFTIIRFISKRFDHPERDKKPSGRTITSVLPSIRFKAMVSTWQRQALS